MAKQLPTILLACLVIVVVLLIQQIVVLRSSITELRATIDSTSDNRRDEVVASESATELDQESDVIFLNSRRHLVVPVSDQLSDPSIERAMQIDRLQRTNPTRLNRLRSWELQQSGEAEEGMKEIRPLLPESTE